MGLAAVLFCSLGVVLAVLTDSGWLVAVGMAMLFVGIALGTWAGTGTD